MLFNLANFIAGQEWIFIIIIAAVFIFGAKKIPELAKTFGIVFLFHLHNLIS